MGSEPDYSDEIAREIDDEIRRIVEGAHHRATELLQSHREALENVSEILVKRETIEREEFLALLDGKTEEQVFPEEPPSSPPPAPAAEAGREERRQPRPLPRPGFGTAMDGG